MVIEAVGASLAKTVAASLAKRFAGRFREAVVERWSKRRARNFFEEFCEEVALECLSGGRSGRLDEILDAMLEDEQCSEVLFDSYRRVALSRSREIGPRILGVLSAQRALAGGLPTEKEESLMEACSSLSDSEFLALAKFIEGYRDHTPSEEGALVRHADGSLEIKWNQEGFDSNWNRNDSISIGPMNLQEELGSWAVKLRGLGLLADDVQERHWEYKEDSERYIDEDGSVREVSWWVHLDSESVRLVEFVRRFEDKVRSEYHRDPGGGRHWV